MKQLDLEAPRVDSTQSSNQRTNSPTVDAIQSSNQRPATVQQSMLSNCGGSHPPRQWPAYGITCCVSKECHWRKMCRSSNSTEQESGKDSQYAGQTPISKHRRRKSPQRCDGGSMRLYRQTTWLTAFRVCYSQPSTNDMANSIQGLQFSAIHKRHG